MNKLISVIIPVYQVEDYLRECVDSVLHQSYNHLEIILVDDGSTDNSPSICDQYGKKDDRVKVVHKQNGGLSDARNVGLDIARGSYISFLDADDVFRVDMLEKLCQALEKTGADIAVCGIEWFNDERIIKQETLFYETINPDKFWRYAYGEKTLVPCVITPNKLYKRALFSNVRFEKNRINEDEIILYDLIKQCSLITFVKGSMYRYRMREGSITHSVFDEKKLEVLPVFFSRARNFENLGQEYLCYLSINRAFDVLKSAINNLPDVMVKKYMSHFWMEYRTFKNVHMPFIDRIKYFGFTHMYKLLKYVRKGYILIAEMRHCVLHLGRKEQSGYRI